LALVSRDITLFSATISATIRFGHPDASDEEVEIACRDAMAHDFIMAMRDG
jgi:ABC-type multidrug transport system fused ATPase/permease subunit